MGLRNLLKGEVNLPLSAFEYHDKGGKMWRGVEDSSVH
jgi:hypothetical protein